MRQRTFDVKTNTALDAKRRALAEEYRSIALRMTDAAGLLEQRSDIAIPAIRAGDFDRAVRLSIEYALLCELEGSKT